MALPTWDTPAGTLGTIEEGLFFTFVLTANDTDEFYVISGNLPLGLSLKASGVIDGVPNIRDTVQGVPSDVAFDVTSTFVIRAVSSTGQVNDRTFTLTVTGQDAPVILTAAGSLGSFTESEYVDVLMLASDPDNDTLTWSVVSGALPPGLSLDSATGRITGYVEPTSINDIALIGFDVSSYDETAYDITTESVDLTHSFAIGVSDGKELVQDNFTMFVTSLPGGTRPPILLADSAELGPVFKSDFFATGFIGQDFDFDQLEYQVNELMTPDTVDADGVTVKYNLPVGLSLNSTTGWLAGTLAAQAESMIRYSFQIRVVKALNNALASDWLDFTISILGQSARDISWISDRDLGTLYAGDVSTLSVEAVDKTGRTLTYSLENYQKQEMPQGVELLPSGELTGRANFSTFRLDGGTTTIDAASTNYTGTTFDGRYTFDVTVRDISETVVSTKEFTLLVIPRATKPHDNLYISALLDDIPEIPFTSDAAIYNPRQYFSDFITDTAIFKTDYIYRAADPYFGIQSDLRMLLLPGVTPAFASSFMTAMETHHYNKTLLFGDIKVAQAKDANGNILYEVVYAEIIDPITGISLSQTLPSAVSNYVGDPTIYPNSLANMISTIVTDVGITSTSLLPIWMTSKQESGDVLGFTPSVVLAYTKPGLGDQLQYNIAESSFDIQRLSFKIDRYIWENTVSSNYDRLLNEFITTAETTFEYQAGDAEPNTYTSFDGGGTRFIVGATSIREYDKYLKFPNNGVLG